MAARQGPTPLAAAATTGNNTHAGVGATEGADKLAVAFKVEVAGATPTVTYKLQATLNGSDWFDVILLPADNETAAVSKTVTAVGVYVAYLAQANVRFARALRLVTSANTNVTYSADLYQHLRP